MTAAMLRRWPRCNGVSRTNSTTSAAQGTRPPVTPVAISDKVRIEQGATTMPGILKKPMVIPRAYVGDGIAVIGRGLDLRHHQVRFVTQRHLGRLAQHQVRLNPELL